MGCGICFLFQCLTVYIRDFCSCVMESSVATLIIALIIALAITGNIYTARMMCNEIYDVPCLGVGGDTVDGDCADNIAGIDEGAVSQVAAERIAYGYTMKNGPHTWNSAQCNQSPINITIKCAKPLTISQPLQWCHYNEMPLGIMLENNGNTVVLRASYCNKVPLIEGAELLACYSFVELCFRWSWFDNEGSEHTLNNRHFPLEMQALHRAGPNEKLTSSYDLLMIAYFYEISTDNPYLDAIIPSLMLIVEPGSRVEIPPFPLQYLMPAFSTNFFSYNGSLTAPPCHRGIEWLVNPEPLAIGPRQLNEFRQLRGNNGLRIMRNARPVQQLGGARDVYFNIYAPDECSETGLSDVLDLEDDSCEETMEQKKCSYNF